METSEQQLPEPVSFAFGVKSRFSHQVGKRVRETIMWWFAVLAILAFLTGLFCLWFGRLDEKPTAPSPAYPLQERKDHTWRNFGRAFLAAAVLAGIPAILLAFLSAT